MAMISSINHSRHPVTDPSYVGEVRRFVVELSKQSNFSEAKVAQARVITSEMATNLAKYAEKGELLVSTRECDENTAIEIVSIDHGPGIENIDSRLVDGFSTSDTLGGGLGSINRMSDFAEICSEPGKGTVLRSLIFQSQQQKEKEKFEIGAISVPHPKEEVNGDGFSYAYNGDQLTLIVLDGLGHGIYAAQAREKAIEAFKEEPFSQPSKIAESIHENLSGTRGTALAIARIDFDSNLVDFVGVGNISANVHRSKESNGCLSTCGVIGGKLGNLKQESYKWAPEATLVLYSDGINSSASVKPYSGLSASLAAGSIYRDSSRNTDDTTIVVVKDLRSDLI